MNGKTLLDVAVPCLDSGRVSGHDLERYTRWVRGKNVAAVLLWSPTAHGEAYEVAEREEILSVWRAGLSPSQNIIATLPVGGRDVPEQELLFQASHARECGTDALAILADSQEYSNNAIWHRISRDLDLPIYQIQGQQVVNLPVDVEDKFTLCVWPDPSIDTDLRVLAMEAHAPIGQLLLWALAEEGIIESTGAFDAVAYSENLDTELRARIRKLLRR